MRSFHLFTAAVALVAGLIANAGCPSREVARVDPAPDKEQQKSLPAQVNRNIDILFVIDDSGSMKEEQESLAANFSNFINVLSNIEGGLPDVHLGIVSTNLGGNADQQCSGTGDAGNLINTPRVRVGCDGPTDRWIESLDPDGDGNRDTNFPPGQTLSDTFSCVAELGTTGCGFEQPLESMKRALQNQANAGFIRENAFLAVIFITDEDDCSVDPVNGQGMFASANCADWKDKSSCPLGALSSFRCFEFGVECDPDNPRQVGDKEVSEPCQPRANSQYMNDVKEYAAFLRDFKGNPSLVITAGIIGPATPVVVEPDTINPPNQPAIETVSLAPSCVQAGTGEAFPGVRLASFFNEFPTRSTTTTICNDDLSDALLQIADLLARVIGSPCLEGDLADTDPSTDGVQPECAVYDVRFPGTDDEVQGSPMPQCNESRSNTPCYVLEVDTDQCGCADPDNCGTPTNLKITIERTEEALIGTEAQIRCVAN